LDSHGHASKFNHLPSSRDRRNNAMRIREQ
jgi:hypothetical protein